MLRIKDFINRITTLWDNPPLIVPGGSKCAICCDTASEEQLDLLPCGHQFHKDCIVRWLNYSSVCPLCRHQVHVKPTYCASSTLDNDTTSAYASGLESSPARNWPRPRPPVATYVERERLNQTLQKQSLQYLYLVFLVFFILFFCFLLKGNIEYRSVYVQRVYFVLDMANSNKSNNQRTTATRTTSAVAVAVAVGGSVAAALVWQPLQISTWSLN